MKRIISLVMALALVLTAMVVPAVAENQDVRTVEFWHTLTGVNGAAVEAIAKRSGSWRKVRTAFSDMRA